MGVSTLKAFLVMTAGAAFAAVIIYFLNKFVGPVISSTLGSLQGVTQ